MNWVARGAGGGALLRWRKKGIPPSQHWHVGPTNGSPTASSCNENGTEHMKNYNLRRRAQICISYSIKHTGYNFSMAPMKFSHALLFTLTLQKKGIHGFTRHTPSSLSPCTQSNVQYSPLASYHLLLYLLFSSPTIHQTTFAYWIYMHDKKTTSS
jgi:hypothetical protein